MSIKLIKFGFTILVIAVLTGCGGSSPDGNTSTAPSNSATNQAPSVIMLSPINNSINVSNSPNIQLQFSESVNNVSESTLTLHEDSVTGSLVKITAPVYGSDNTYVFSPESDLIAFKKYYVVLNSNITSIATGKSLEPTSFNFITGNLASPMVSMITPTNGSTDVSLSTTIQLRFSRPVTNVTESTVTLHLGSPMGATVEISSIIHGDGDSYTFSPSSNLNGLTKYFVELSNQIVSADSNVPLESAMFNFRTGNYATPTVSMIKPLNGTTGVLNSPNIQLKFSERVNNVTESTVTLHADNPTGRLVASGHLIQGKKSTYTFSPLNALDSNRQYYVVLNSGIVSNNNIPLKTTNFNFTIGDYAAPSVSILNPLDNSMITSLNPKILLHFSESVTDVDTDSITIYNKTLEKAVQLSSITLESNNIYLLNLSESLNINSFYTIQINSRIRSVRTGQRLERSLFTFRTGAPTFAYIAEDGKAPITICYVGQYGKFKNCHSSIWAIDYPSYITIDPSKKFIYATGSIGDVLVCPINRVTGDFSCNPSGVYFSKPTSIAFSPSNKHVYVADSSSRAKMWLCDIDYLGDAPSNCVYASNGQINSPNKIIVNAATKTAYVSSVDNNSISICSIADTTESLTNCSVYNSTFNNPIGLAISNNGQYFYTTNNNTDILSAPIDQANGNLGKFSLADSGYTSLISIFLSENNYLYIADSGNAAITVCKEDEILGHTDHCYYTSRNHFNISDIAILYN